MVTELRKTNKTLYETDYNLWIVETAQKLQSRDLDNLDWDNLIEELLSLSRSDKRKLESLLMRLIEHLLKLSYWEIEKERNQNHWKGEIRSFRLQIISLLEDSPSLKPYTRDILGKCYANSCKVVGDKTQLPLSTFPAQPIATLEQVLDEDWFP